MNNDLEQLSEERLKELVKNGLVGVLRSNEIIALARIALSAKQAKPVAYMYRDNLHSDARFSLTSKIGNWSSEEISEYEIAEIPLYTTPQPAHTDQDGWMLAPLHVTSAMAEAGKDIDKRLSIWKCQDIYQAMLAAAPKPESE